MNVRIIICSINIVAHIVSERVSVRAHSNLSHLCLIKA